MIVKDINILTKKSIVTTKEECDKKKLWLRLEQALFTNNEPGYGLAAVQIGEHIRAVLLKGEVFNFKIINPVIISKSKKFVHPGEGCLSLPGERYNTDRYEEIEIEYLDGDSGKTTKQNVDGILAVILQHECHHLDGILIRDIIHKKEEKIKRNEPCPFCLSQGIQIKWKKCKIHNKEN